MTEQQRKERLIKMARYILSRLLSLAASVRVVSLDLDSGKATVYFNPAEADVALLNALKVGVQ